MQRKKTEMLLVGLVSFFSFLITVSFGQDFRPGNAPPQFSPSRQPLPDKIVTRQVELTLQESTVRVIETYPFDLTTNNDNVLANFKTRVIPVENKLLRIEINQPVIIEVSPFSVLGRAANKRFGAQLAGQVNELLPPAYRTNVEYAGRQERIMQLLSLAGVGSLRDLHSYDTRRYHIEKSAGNYDFSNTDWVTGLAHRYQMDIVARLSLHGGVPRNLPEGLPSDIDSYRRYIRKTVERYDGDADFGCELAPPDCYTKGDGQFPDTGNDPQAWAKTHVISFWETLKEPEPGRRNRVGNEPGLSAENAAYLLNLSYDAVKSADKNAPVYFSGMGPVQVRGSIQERRSSENNYMKNMFASNKARGFDILGFDAYTQDLREKAAETLSIIRCYRDYHQPLWIGQIGAPDVGGPGPYGGNNRRQSEDMVKIFTSAFAYGIEKVFWGDFLDTSKEKSAVPGLSSGGKTLMQATGLFYTETWELKPAYFTFKLLSAAFLDIDRIECIAANIFKFSRHGRSDIYVVWPSE